MRIRLITYLIIPLVLIIGLQGLTNYFFLFPAVKKNIVNEKKLMLAELTRVVINSIDNCISVYGDSLPEPELQKLVIEHIRHLNYGNDQKSYFWVTDLTPRMVMHPYRSDMEGKILTNYKDINGNALFDTAVDLVKRNGEGYLEYYWQFQDDSTRNIPKISYVKLYEKWKWIIGTGIYINDIDEELTKLRKNELKGTLMISGIMLILVFGIGLFGLKNEKLRKKAQNELKLSEEKFRNIFQNSNDIIIISTLEGIIIDINSRALAAYNLSYEDIIGKASYELIPEKYRNKILERIQKVGSEDLEPIEVELIPINNKVIIVEIKSCLLSYENQNVILSTLRDITEQKTHEKNLIESRLRYKIVADYNSDWEYWLGLNGEFIYISPSCKRLTGYEPEEFIANPGLYNSIIADEDKKIWESHHEFVFSNHVRNEMIQFRIIHKQGFVVWIEHSCQPVFDDRGNYLGVRGSNRDITIRKVYEDNLINTMKTLEVSERKFKDLSNLTFEGILIHENGIAIDVNLSLLNMFGYSSKELKDKYILDLLFDQKSQNKLLSNIKKNYTEPYEVVGIKKDGTLFPVEVEGKSYFLESSGKYIRVSAFRDITLRKKAENEIKKLSKAVDQSANMVIITDAKGIIEYANERFYKITGFTKEEVIGKTPGIVNSGRQDKQFYTELWDTILKGKVWRGELCNKKKDGEIYWESMLITPIFNDNNKLTSFMAVKEDISDKKLAEIKLFNAIIETEERERKKFAEDLHDELGPHLSGIRLYINELEDDAIKLKRKKEIITMLDVLIKEAIDKTRTISNQLMPSILIDFGLIKALESFCSRINNTKTIQIKLNYDDDELGFDKTTEIVVYRVIIELINNTIKHAGAKIINIDFIKQGETVELVYQDDGVGFNLNDEIKNRKGLGLNNVFNRMKTIESSCHFESYPQKGSIFRFSFLSK